MMTTVPAAAAVVAAAVAAAVVIVVVLQFLGYLMRKKTVKEKDENQLAKVYYDPSQPEGYAGTARLKKKFPKQT